MSGLTVVKPLPITPAMLVSCSVPETDYVEWAIDATYAKGQRVIVLDTHKVYQSTADGNTGNDPTVPMQIHWAEVGATNRWKVFDASVSTQTRQADAMSWRIKPGTSITSLNLLNMRDATSVRVRVIAPDTTVVYDRTIDVRRVPLASSWWAWFFGERRAPTQVLLSDLPSYPTAEIQIDVEGTADLAVGVILMGQMRSFTMGAQYGARLGIQDYSRKDRNDFGDVVIVERAFSRRASYSMILKASEVDVLHRFLSDVRATACLWIVSEKRYETSTVYGFYKSFDIVISYFDYSECDLELEGLT